MRGSCVEAYIHLTNDERRMLYGKFFAHRAALRSADPSHPGSSWRERCGLRRWIMTIVLPARSESGLTVSTCVLGGKK